MISVVIPTYKNKKQLIANLENNLEFLSGCEIIIVNDDPSYSLKDDLKRFSNITLIENKKNLGFGQTINVGVERTKYPLVMLLNDDVILRDKNFEKAISHFKKNGRLFAVSFAQKEDGGEIVGKNKIYWKNGMINHSKADDFKFGKTGWAEGGSCLVDKKKFLQVGGFDPAFSPFYWEDIDLSYRAVKLGFEIIFDPKIQVEHHHESTIGKYFDKKTITRIAFRNQLIFIWKNVHELWYLMSHLFFLPFYLAYFAITGKFEYIAGFIDALKNKNE